MNITMSVQKTQRGILEVLVALSVVVGATALAHCSTGCAPVTFPSQAELDAQYQREIRNCSERAASKEAAKACRIDVYRRFGLCDAPWPYLTPCDTE